MPKKRAPAPKPTPTIAQLKKLEKAQEAREKSFYAATDRLREYRKRVEDLGHGYSEVVDGVTNVIAITNNRQSYPEMIIVEVKSPC